MTRWTLFAAITAALVAVPATAAVTLDAGGLGQGLLFPYFSTNNGQNTLVTVQNTSAQGKALKLRVLESYAGAETLTFNIYLAPGGSWNAALGQANVDPWNGEFANLRQSGENCTVPSMPDEGLDLRPYAFMDDGGPQNRERTHEGMIEVVEMGTLSPALAEITRNPTIDSCLPFQDRFDGGIWATQPNTDLSAPSGGLRGSAVIVNVGNGTSFDYPALAFNGLAVAPRQYSVAPPNQNYALPRLTDVQVPAGENIEVNLIDSSGAPVTLRYGSADGYAAISALLANHASYSNFNVATAFGARTEWIYSFPTRRAHPAIVIGTPPPGAAAATFEGDTEGCTTVALSLTDRNGGGSGTSESVDLCGSAGVMRFAAEDGDEAQIVALDDDPVIKPAIASGVAKFDFSEFDGHARRNPADLDGRCYTGLPIWSMAVSAYDNNNAQEGRIATFPVEEVPSRITTIVDCSNG